MASETFEAVGPGGRIVTTQEHFDAVLRKEGYKRVEPAAKTSATAPKAKAKDESTKDEAKSKA